MALDTGISNLSTQLRKIFKGRPSLGVLGGCGHLGHLGRPGLQQGADRRAKDARVIQQLLQCYPIFFIEVIEDEPHGASAPEAIFIKNVV
jgi:hypothetical protein